MSQGRKGNIMIISITAGSNNLKTHRKDKINTPPTQKNSGTQLRPNEE